MGDTTAAPETTGAKATDLTDEQATALIERHSDLVYNIAHGLQQNLPEEIPLEDLVSWGYAGLLEAHRRYDDSKATQFGTYAYYRIRGAMLDACPEPIVDPQRRRTEVSCNEVLEVYAHVVRNQRHKTTIENRLSMLSDVTGSMMMIFVLNDCPEKALRNEGAPHQQQMVRRQTADKLREAVEELTDNEQAIIEGVYFEERSLTEMADEMGYSPSWTSRLHTRALENLQKIIDGDSDYGDLRNAVPI